MEKQMSNETQFIKSFQDDNHDEMRELVKGGFNVDEQTTFKEGGFAVWSANLIRFYDLNRKDCNINQHYERFKFIVGELKSDPNIADSERMTALSHLCMYLNYDKEIKNSDTNNKIIEMIKLSLESGTDVNIESRWYGTPFKYFSQKILNSNHTIYLDLFKLFVSSGADIYYQCESGMTFYDEIKKYNKEDQHQRNPEYIEKMLKIMDDNKSSN